MQLIDGTVVFVDPDAQLMCAGEWSVIEFRRGGNVGDLLAIAPPVGKAA